METVHRADRDRTIVFRVRNRNAVVNIFRASFERQKFSLNVRVRPTALPDVENSTARCIVYGTVTPQYARQIRW